MIDSYLDSEIAKGKYLQISENSLDFSMCSNRTLLNRVINNMLKNAIEGSNPGETITMGCERHDLKVTFWIHNNGFILPDDQLQVFQRSFSTKGMGRGLGTYSMKLLTEKYLGGKVYFNSSENKGTTFFAEFPIFLDND